MAAWKSRSWHSQKCLNPRCLAVIPLGRITISAHLYFYKHFPVVLVAGVRASAPRTGCSDVRLERDAELLQGARELPWGPP